MGGKIRKQNSKKKIRTTERKKNWNRISGAKYEEKITYKIRKYERMKLWKC